MIKRDMPEQISKVCVKWQTDSPFFAEFLLRLTYKNDPGVGTMAIGMHNRRIMLWYSPEFMEGLKQIQIEGLLVHEIMHILHRFHDRLGTRDKQIFNVAQDACINEIVLKTTIANRRLQLPENGVDIEDIREMGYKGDVISEPVYDFLYEKADKISISSSGGGDQCQSCSGSGGNSGENGEEDCPSCGGSGKEKNEPGKKKLSTTDNHDYQKQLSEIDKQVIEEVINNAKTRSYGNISGNMVGEIKELIKTKSIPWKRKLAMFLARYVNEPGGIYENTWSKRNRRSLPLPGIRKKSKKLVVTVDTSGSVGNDDIQRFFGQIEKLVKDYSSLTIIEWDTQIQHVYQYKKGDWKKIKVHGRGGTYIQPLYDYVKENLRTTSVVINFTDGYFDWNVEHYSIPTIWAFVNNEMTAPFGKTLLIKDAS